MGERYAEQMRAIPAGKIRVLLTYGGHGFEQQPFFALFESIPDLEVTRAELPKQAELLKPGLEKQFDVIVRYDMCPKIVRNSAPRSPSFSIAASGWSRFTTTWALTATGTSTAR